MLDVSHWQELPAAAFSPSGVGGGQITQDRTPPSSICPGLARSSEVSTKQLYHFLGPSEVRSEGAQERVGSLQNDYKNKHFINQDSQRGGGFQRHHWAALLRLGASVGTWGRKKLSRTCWPGLGFFRLDRVATWDLLEPCAEDKGNTEVTAESSPSTPPPIPLI